MWNQAGAMVFYREGRDSVARGSVATMVVGTAFTDVHRHAANIDRTPVSRGVGAGVGAALLATCVTHLVLLSRALGPDEGGFLVVARHWHEPGTYLYGPLWVDRPPGLIMLFSAADTLGPLGVRVMVTLLAVSLVFLCAQTSRLVGGDPVWAAWTAYAFGSSVLLQGQQLNGEYAAIVCVSASILLVVLALRRQSRGAFVLSAAAGASAAAAVTMKQNFLDGFVFAAVLLGALALFDRSSRRTVAAVASGMLAGTALVVVAVLTWAHHHQGLGALIWAMYGFRAQAVEVMDHGSWAPAGLRLLLLLALCLVSGLLLLSARLLIHGRKALVQRKPLALALAAVALFDLLSLASGGNYWAHYALTFIPVVAVSAGLASRVGHSGWMETRRLIVIAAAMTAVIAPIAAFTVGPSRAWQIGRWVHDSAQRSDTIVVPYTHPNVVAASELRPAYPYLWSLPVRVNDPDLETLTGALERGDGATWVVFYNLPNTWGLDQRGEMERTLRARYRKVAKVCGHPVWLRNGVSRDFAPLPTDCGDAAL